MNRREFLSNTAGAMALAAAAPHALAAGEPGAPSTPTPKRQLKKGIMWGTVGVKGSVLEKMKAVKVQGGGGDPVYGLGVVGACMYYMSLAQTPQEKFQAFGKALQNRVTERPRVVVCVDRKNVHG